MASPEKWTVPIALVLAAVTFQPAFGQDGGYRIPIRLKGTEPMGLVRHSTLTTDDQVTDNCWTNADSIRSKIFLIFSQNDIFVPDYVPAYFNSGTVVASISANGFRTGSGICAVSATFSVYTKTVQNLGGADGRQEYAVEYLSSIYDNGMIATNSTNVNSALDDFFIGAASEFAAKVITARKSENVTDFFQDYPPQDATPMSVEEFKEMMMEAMKDMAKESD